MIEGRCDGTVLARLEPHLMIRDISFTCGCLTLGLVLGWLTTDFNKTHMEALLKWAPIYGPLLPFIGLLVAYLLSEKSKKKDRKLAILRASYLDIWGDWAQVQIHMMNTVISDPADIAKVMERFAASLARLNLVAPLDIIPRIHAIGALVREIYPPLLIRRRDQLQRDLQHQEAKSRGLNFDLSEVSPRERGELLKDSFDAASRFRWAILPVGVLMRKDLEGDDEGGKYERLLAAEISELEKRLVEIIKMATMPAGQ